MSPNKRKRPSDTKLQVDEAPTRHTAVGGSSSSDSRQERRKSKFGLAPDVLGTPREPNVFERMGTDSL